VDASGSGSALVQVIFTSAALNTTHLQLHCSRFAEMLMQIVVWLIALLMPCSVIKCVGGIWREVVEKDCQARKLTKEIAVDHSRWRKLIKDVR